MSQEVQRGVFNLDLAIVASSSDLSKASTSVEGDLMRESPMLQLEKKSSPGVQNLADNDTLGLFLEQSP